MGKGKFICDLAKQNPNINYVGIEKYSSVASVAIKKMMEIESIFNELPHRDCGMCGAPSCRAFA